MRFLIVQFISVIVELLLEHGGQPHVLPLTIHLEIAGKVGWII